jgi:Immunity protein 27
MNFNDLDPAETDLRGERPDTAQRIQWLIENRLQHLATDSSGWESLYRDPHDGRLWERTYPDSERHGGGPPRLHTLSRDDAASKYGLRAV